MNYKLTKLSNGIKVLTVPMPSLESATVTVWVGVGSRFEDKKVNGISHFLEHMVFKGSQKRPSFMIISEALDAMGGEFNAGTNKEWTNFYIKVQKGKIPKAFDVLSDMILNPLIKKADIKQERKVILEEMAMKEDNPRSKIWDVFENLIYKGNPLGWDILGTQKAIKSIKRENFANYRNKFYYPKNILITVSGGIKEKQILELSQKYFAHLDQKREKRIKKFKSSQKKPQLLLEYKKSDQAHLFLGFLGNPLGHKDRFSESILSSILGGGKSSRLFTEIREKRGLAYSIYSSIDRVTDTGYIFAQAGVDVKRIDEAIKVILEEFYKMKNIISPKELNKAKEYVKGQLALSLEDTINVNSFFGLRQLLLGKIETPDKVMDKVDKVTISDVAKIAQKLFEPKRLNLAIIGPYKDKKRFEKLLL